MNSLLDRHVFVFNPSNNGGESLCLTTEFYSNGDPGEAGIYTNQEFTLSSYFNSASFNFLGQMTPENLRRLADELELAQEEAIRRNTPHEHSVRT